jgi:hypothetical protein
MILPAKLVQLGSLQFCHFFNSPDLPHTVHASIPCCCLALLIAAHKETPVISLTVSYTRVKMYGQHNVEVCSDLCILKRWSCHLIHWCHTFCSCCYSQFVHTLYNVKTIIRVCCYTSSRNVLYVCFQSVFLTSWVTHNT